jgi:hypothetical protein
MTEQNPITPPPELRDKWLDEAPNTSVYDYLIDNAAQWGADQELEACCTVIKCHGWFADPRHRIAELRTARRPKPPSLKEQARSELIDAYNAGQIDDSTYDTIRRALEALPDE